MNQRVALALTLLAACKGSSAPPKPAPAAAPPPGAISRVTSLPALPAAPAGPAYLARVALDATGARVGLGVTTVDGGAFRATAALAGADEAATTRVAVGQGGELIATGLGVPLRLAADGTIARTRLPDGDRPRLEDAAVAATSDGALWAWWPTLPRRFWRLPPDGTTWSPVEGPAIDATTGTVDARGGLWAATFSAVWHRAADAWTEVQLVGLPHETMVDELIATRTGAVFAMVRGGKRDLAMARDPDAAPDAHTRAEQIAAGAAFTGLVEVSSARPTLIPDVVAHHVRCVATGGGGRIAFVGRDGETTIYDPATAAVLALAAPEVPVGDCDTAAMDDAGRVWIATTRGLLVRDAAGAPTFYPRGSDPAFRTGIASVAVVGAGPALPPVAPIARGRIEGTLIGRSGRPAAGAQLVACRAVDILSHQCDDVAASVTTDPRGRFLLADLPVADWELAAFEAGASTWEVILEHRCNMTADQPCLITLEAEPE